MVEIQIDHARCAGCGLCVDFCPVEVFDLAQPDETSGRSMARAARQEACWACDTCVGQCPTGAIQVIQTKVEGEDAAGSHAPHAEPVSREEQALYLSWHQALSDTLGLRWHPVGVSLISANTALPDVPVPPARMRYCQSLMAARRGLSLLMLPQQHACPDGAHILGLTEIPPKLASGELYVHFKKMDSREAARLMVEERPRLLERSMQATLVTPLKDSLYRPDIVAVIANPEQIMWLCMSMSFYRGQRFEFKVSGYNAQCVETTLIPYTSGKINVSFGCYGCRASSDISDDLMFMGIPLSEMPIIVQGLQALGEEAIPDSRAKIYMRL